MLKTDEEKRYCAICGDTYCGKHKCDQRKLARRDAAMTADRYTESRGLTESDRMAEGFKMMEESEDGIYDDE